MFALIRRTSIVTTMHLSRPHSPSTCAVVNSFGECAGGTRAFSIRLWRNCGAGFQPARIDAGWKPAPQRYVRMKNALTGRIPPKTSLDDGEVILQFMRPAQFARVPQRISSISAPPRNSGPPSYGTRQSLLARSPKTGLYERFRREYYNS